MQEGHTSTIQTLLSLGADLHAKDGKNRSGKALWLVGGCFLSTRTVVGTLKTGKKTGSLPQKDYSTVCSVPNLRPGPDA